MHTAPEYDLALTKSLKAGQPRTVETGDIVTFTIEVENQGTVTANTFDITDRLPSGLTLNDTDWTSIGGNNASITINKVLVPGDTTAVDITVRVGNITGRVVNVAEISSDDGDDIDSTPNNDDGDQSEDEEDNEYLNVMVPTPDEICNGRDDDNDGDVDEGFEDKAEGMTCDDGNERTFGDQYNAVCVCTGTTLR